MTPPGVKTLHWHHMPTSDFTDIRGSKHHNLRSPEPLFSQAVVARSPHPPRLMEPLDDRQYRKLSVDIPGLRGCDPRHGVPGKQNCLLPAQTPGVFIGDKRNKAPQEPSNLIRFFALQARGLGANRADAERLDALADCGCSLTTTGRC